jgi:three-Cys-motif partner protein
MAVPDDTLWEIEPHTEAKHAILREYLKAWIPILGQSMNKIAYVDGFAGPGKYKGGEPGSPEIALRCAMKHRGNVNQMTFLFIEKREDRIEHLENHLADLNPPDHFDLHLIHGEFEDVIGDELDAIKKKGLRMAPTFAFIDPFGWKGLPMPLLHRILDYRSTEVFTNFAVDPANRFKDHPDEGISTQIKRLFGGEIPERQDPTENGHDFIRRVYKERLQERADFVRSFRMLDRENRPIYDLFFASNNSKGHEKMKAAMWKVDTSGQFVFSDATNEQQTVLFEEDPAPQLLEMIMNEWGDEGRVRAGDIEEWVLNQTTFLRKHKTAALEMGENGNAFYVENEKANGEPRYSGFPDEVIINFEATPPGEQGGLF